MKWTTKVPTEPGWYWFKDCIFISSDGIYHYSAANPIWLNNSAIEAFKECEGHLFSDSPILEPE